jgi:hypothetical protein
MVSNIHPELERAFGYHGPPSEQYVMPFRLEHDPMERLMVANLDDDPDFTGIELQAYDDAVKGRGMAVLLYRVDEKTDWYLTPGLELDRQAADVGAGVGEWTEQAFDNRFEITAAGVDTRVELTLVDGRSLELEVAEHHGARGQGIDLLAPIGVGIREPRFFPLFLMHGMELVPRHETDARVRIGGVERSIERIPVPVPHTGHRSYLMRYCDDPLIVRVNPALDGGPLLMTPTPHVSDGDVCYRFQERDGHPELRRMSLAAGTHEVWFSFEPEFPDLLALAEGAHLEGEFHIGVDDAAVVGGAYEVRQDHGLVSLALQPTEEWHPHGGPLEWLTVRMFPSFFRTWPTTYRWTADLELESLKLAARWERVPV